MQWLAAICVRRPIFATVIVLVLSVVGFFSYLGLGVDRFPRVEFPVVAVTTVVPGSAPAQVETEVTDKIEGAINSISGIDELRSISVEGVSQVFVQFTLDKDVNVAAQEINENISTVLGQLPAGAERPSVIKLDPDATPILTLVVSGTGSVRDVTEYADKGVRRRLEGVNGVGQVVLVGGQRRQINVWIDPAKLDKLGLAAVDVERALRSQNIELPSGRVEQGDKQLTLRTLGRVSSVEELRSLGGVTRERAIALLERFRFPYEHLHKRVEDLSGGERNRLQLAKLIWEQPNLLILDEPTNHLDIPTCEAVEEALDGFAGTLLVVSHDRYFLDNVVERVVEVRDRRLHTFPGNFSAFWAARQQAEPATVVGRVTRRRRQRENAYKQARRDAQRRELESRIEAAEAERAALEARIAEAFTAGEHQLGRRLANELAQLKAQLDGLLARWVEDEA